MSRRAAQCPSCAGPVEFVWAQAVQTTCPYCRSVLVREDLDLRRVGQVADLLPSVSRVQIGTTGQHGGHGFRVIGRIAYEYERGAWNEWHLLFSDGRSGWLSDAQAEYAVTFVAPPPEGRLPAAEEVELGDQFCLAGTEFRVTALTWARYVGVEGELPFEYHDKDQVLFVDLRGAGNRFGTLDFSDPESLLFTGEAVEFVELALANLAEAAPTETAAAGALGCPNCGGVVQLRAAGQTVSVTCPSCSSVLDATSPRLTLLQSLQRQLTAEPLIPLGSRGELRGATWEIIGFQVQTIQVEGEAYSWGEYVLWNPERGFRYLTEYQGHWNDVVPLKTAPTVRSGSRPTADVHGERFRHFQTAEAETSFVLGEFPWRARVGDRVRTADYVAPPRMLSSETAPEEQSWSLGEYTPGERIWQAFRLPGKPPKPRGVFANQPSPHVPGFGRLARTFGILALLLGVLAVLRWSTARNESVFFGAYTWNPPGAGTPLAGDSAGWGEANLVVTEPFELRGRPSNVHVSAQANLNNAWLYLDLALIDQATGRAYEWGQEVSFYQGVEGGERWSEGSLRDHVRVRTVPAGRYVLRVIADADPASPPIAYSLRLRRDVPSASFLAMTILLLAAPLAFAALRSGAWESARWRESDYAESGS